MIDNRVMLLRSLKGSACSTLLALLLYADRSLGAGELATLTGYSDKSIAAGLKTLSAIGLAQRHGRYQAWTSTASCRQLILRNDELTACETEIFRLPSSSSSCSNQSPDTVTELLPPQERSDTENFRLPEEWQPALDALTATGLPAHTARDLLTARIQANHTDPGALVLDILLWSAYATDPRHTKINNPPYFVAAQIKAGRTCPATYQPAEGGPLTAEIRRRARRRSADYES